MLIYLQMIDSIEDKDKFEWLYAQYRNLMYHAACQILRNEADAEDAVHEAFLSIAKNIKEIRCDEKSNAKALVVLIAERKAIDMLRQRRRNPETPLDDETPGLSIPPPGDGGLADVMAKLPASYRELLILSYGMGYKPVEIARIMGKKPDAVRKTIQRAKNALRKLLDEEENNV